MGKKNFFFRKELLYYIVDLENRKPVRPFTNDRFAKICSQHEGPGRRFRHKSQKKCVCTENQFA